MATLPDGIQLTWLGHATFIVVTPGGKRLLIDPWLSGNPACPDDMKDPGDLDAILITHAHFDHVGDLVDVAKSSGAPVVTINETAAWLGTKGIENATGMNIGGTFEIADVKVHMVEALHSNGIQDGDDLIYGGVAAGLVIEFENGFKLYHAGDTAVFTGMSLIGKLLKPDWALLPIGDHYTMGPASAAEAIRLLGVKTVVPMHFGTFPVLVGTPDALREAAADVSELEIVQMEPGETLK